MRNKISIDELIKKRFSENKASEILNEADNEVQEIKWGGARINAGRKAKPKTQVLQFTKRLTQKEAMFIDYARAHNINYDDLMQG